MELEALVRLVDGKLSKDDETAIEELHQYLIEGEGSWALGDGFLLFVGRILESRNVPTDAKVHLLRTLAAAALKDDVILLLHQDRRDHILMNFALDIDRKSPEEQEGIALFVRIPSHSVFRNWSIVERLSAVSLDVQFVREYQHIRVVAVHFRVGEQQSANVEHTVDDKSGGPLPAGHVQQTARHRHGHDP